MRWMALSHSISPHLASLFPMTIALYVSPQFFVYSISFLSCRSLCILCFYFLISHWITFLYPTKNPSMTPLLCLVWFPYWILYTERFMHSYDRGRMAVESTPSLCISKNPMQSRCSVVIIKWYMEILNWSKLATSFIRIFNGLDCIRY